MMSEARPLDIGDRDLAGRPGPDCPQHFRIDDRAQVALALQFRFRVIDAAGHVDRQDQLEVDRLLRRRPVRRGGGGCEEKEGRRGETAKARRLSHDRASAVQHRPYLMCRRRRNDIMAGRPLHAGPQAADSNSICPRVSRGEVNLVDLPPDCSG